MSQHTPGPWDVIDRHFEPRYVVKLGAPNDETAGFTGICQPDRSEDCYLIAAAPDLLTAVKMVIDDANFAMLQTETCAALEAAVRKAENRPENGRS